MKKTIKWLAVLAAMIMALAFAGCSDSSDDDDDTPAPEPVQETVKTPSVQDPSETQDPPSALPDWSKAVVGDIVLTDGTFVSASEFDSNTHKAAAVIVRAKSGDTPALGVGIHRSETGLAWCTEDAKAYDTNITDLVGNKTTGYMDGSDGWTVLNNAVSNDAANKPEEYPAWNFCNTYGTTNGLTGALATGWYLPALAELKTIYNNKTTIDASLSLVGGSQFGTSWYWSCCQYSSYDDNAYELDFGNGFTEYDNKTINDSYVCSVRAFN